MEFSTLLGNSLQTKSGVCLEIIKREVSLKENGQQQKIYSRNGCGVGVIGSHSGFRKLINITFVPFFYDKKLAIISKPMRLEFRFKPWFFVSLDVFCI